MQRRCPLRAQVAPFLNVPARFESGALSRAALSLFLGALTHLVWDSFTHPGAPVVNAFAILRTPWMRIGSEELVGYRVLQLASTAIGLAALGLWLLRWRRANGSTDDPSTRAALDPMRAATLGGLFGVAFGFATHASVSGFMRGASFSGVMRPLRDAAIAGMEGLLFAVVTFSARWHALLLLERLRGVRTNPSDGSR